MRWLLLGPSGDPIELDIALADNLTDAHGAEHVGGPSR